MSDGVPISKIEPLKSGNYPVWALQVSAVLRNKGLFTDVIEKPEPLRTANQLSNEWRIRQEWEKKNNEAFSIIILTLSPEQAGLFLGETNAKKIWDELSRIHLGNIEDKKIDITLELRHIRMGHNESVDAYINRGRNIASRSATLGQIIPERELVFYLVRGLTSRFDSIAPVLRTQRSASIEEVVQSLREEEWRLNERSKYSRTNDRQESAYKARSSFGRGSYHNRAGLKPCTTCGRMNHRSQDCWYRDQDRKTPNAISNKSSSTQQRRTTGNDHNKPTQKRHERAFTTLADEVEEDNEEEKNSQAGNHWIIDSGCSSHMTPVLDWMTEVVPFETAIKLAEDGREIRSVARGQIRSYTRHRDGTIQDICIKNVLYVPELRTNLLSVHKLLENGNELKFSDKSVQILDEEGVLMAEALETDSMYMLEMIPKQNVRRESGTWMANMTQEKGESSKETKQGESENKETDETFKVGEGKEDKMLWHNRLCHLNDQYMETMKDGKMTIGLNFKSEKLGLCEACIMGKLVQDSHKPLEKEPASSPLELVYMDLCGPFPVESIGKARYVFVLVDSYTRYTFSYPLKSKTETLEKFIAFMNKAERETGQKVKRVRSDNGQEFCNKDFDSYLVQKGIHHEKTVPYTPQNNAVAERTLRTIVDKARTMLLSANLPGAFWGEAVQTAVYVKNRTPTKVLKDVTPYERWYGRKPNISYLKTFGCIAYYYIPTAKRDKLEPKGRKGVFVGYSLDRKAYRIIDPDSLELIVAQTVKFDERVKGGTLINHDSELGNPGEVQYCPKQVQSSRVDTDSEDEILSNEEVTDRTTEERTPEETTERFTEAEDRQDQAAKQIPTERPRRSERLEKKRQEAIRSKMTYENISIPTTYEEAISSEYAEEWKAAMDSEIKSLGEHETWELVPKSQAHKILKSKWVFACKRGEHNEPPRFKARLVAVGSRQQPGLDFATSYAPVVRLESFRLLMAMAEDQDLEMRQYDIKTAYLYGDLTEEVYMHQPTGFNEDKSKVCRLKRSLYGLPQSGYCWNTKLNTFLLDIGLSRLESDACVYKYEESGKIFLMCLYVDDILAVGTDKDIIEKVMQKIGAKFDLREVSAPLTFLGIDIQEHENNIVLHQGKYVQKILKTYGLENCNTVKTPCDPSQDLDEHENSQAADKEKYQKMLGSLMYLSMGTRPDITYGVNKLAQYSNNPKGIHMLALKRIYRYLKGTSQYGLVYRKDSTTPILNVSTDASWNSAAGAKSITGYTVKIGSSLISWKSQKQNMVALSTCESELMALCEGVREVKWTISLLEELGMERYIAYPIQVKSDSMAAISWCDKKGFNARTKHISRKFHFIRDEVENKVITIQHVKGTTMEADILTKPTTYEKLAYGRQMLNIHECNEESQLHIKEGE